MTNLTDPKPATAPRLAAAPEPADILTLVRECDAQLRRLTAQVGDLDTQVRALTPTAVLAEIDAQIVAARANLAENIKWMELTTMMMTRARKMFADLAPEETLPALTASLPNAGNLAAVLTGNEGPKSSEDELASLMKTLTSAMGGLK